MQGTHCWESSRLGKKGLALLCSIPRSMRSPSSAHLALSRLSVATQVVPTSRIFRVSGNAHHFCRFAWRFSCSLWRDYPHWQDSLENSTSSALRCAPRQTMGCFGSSLSGCSVASFHFIITSVSSKRSLWMIPIPSPEGFHLSFILICCRNCPWGYSRELFLSWDCYQIFS